MLAGLQLYIAAYMYVYECMYVCIIYMCAQQHKSKAAKFLVRRDVANERGAKSESPPFDKGIIKA